MLWVALSIGIGQFSLNSISGILGSAALLCVIAIGQMLVVTTGNGAVDLSIPNVMTMSAFVATSLINGQDSRLWSGILVALAIGLIVGWFNALIVNHLRIPPIIATLATGYILTTATLLFNRGFRTYAISQFLSIISSGHLGPIPILLILATGLTVIVIWLLHGTAYGRCLAAVGQNSAAAELSGIQVDRTKQAAYMLSGLLAALGGVFLSGRVSGAFLEMGNPFLLQSVGAVVVGGSSILGGRGTALGTLLGSIFLVMIVTTMQVLRLAGGFQDVAQGILIIFVLAIATVKRR